ncbi:MAG: NAD-dependent DNA ligase LigA [Candidatus Marinimicrobia bacterium]|nr:NAD-dependent DNA ligase LigA [Candidatus Neomarinimicrobiota bacterium]
MKNIEEQITKLKNDLNHHSYRYYVLNNPTISDFQYDEMLRELEKLEKKYPELKTLDSPTQRVGAPILKSFDSLKHRTPMLSLSNAKNKSEIIEFYNRVLKLAKLEKVEFVGETKLDGLGVELIYEKGIFVAGATRGDGFVGENITQNLRTIKQIPLKLLGDKIPDILEVRGEVIISNENFRKLNEQREKDNEQLFANPRNASAGSLRQLDSKITKKRPLEIFIYAFGEITNNDFETHFDFLEQLKLWGFPTNPYNKILANQNEMTKYFEELESKRNSLPYDIDGVVFKVNSLELQDKLGMRTRTPRWAIAGKFKPKREITQILSIDEQVGRTGIITPVANLKPVKISGAIISRVTLHNQDEIDRKDIRVNDFVVVERAGDVIPKVIKVITEKRGKNSKTYKLPNECPVCHSPTIKIDSGVLIKCSNISCPAQVKKSIEHFISKKAMDISGAEATINLLVESKLISNIADLYKLEENDLITLERFGEKSAKKLINSIEKSKTTTLPKLIFALGIPNVGEYTSRILAEKYNNLGKLLDAKKDELIELEDIGPIVAESIFTFVNDEKNVKVILELINYGINPIFQSTKIELQNFRNKTFVITGTLDKYSRDEAKLLIEKAGGKATNSVSKKTDFLLAGEKAGSKLENAKKLNVKILNEKEFDKMLSE